MHVPSPSDYVPLDSHAPAFFRQGQISAFIDLAVVTLVLYDHLITLDIEVERIWTLRWGLPKFLFFVSRYVVPPLLMITVISDTGYPLLFSFCTFTNRVYKSFQFLSLVIAQLVLIIRVSALYGHGRLILTFLVCLFIGQLAGIIVVIVVFEKLLFTVFSYEFLPGCSFGVGTSRSDVRWEYSWPIPFICFDGILLILTLIKAFSYRDNFNPTCIRAHSLLSSPIDFVSRIRLLARDSVFYFSLIFSSLVENILVNTQSIQVDVFIPSEWIACIAVSRMMMNIRGLLFNDPLGSQGLHFSTRIFQKRDSPEDEGSFRRAGAERHPLGGV